MYVLNKRNSNQIYNNAVADIKAFTGMSEVRDNSTLSGVMRAMSRRMEELYDSIEANFLAGYARTAGGPWLDAMAAEWGLTRQITTQTNVPCASNTFILKTQNGNTIFSNLGLSPSAPMQFLNTGVNLLATSNASLYFILNETVRIGPTLTSVSLGAYSELANGQVIPAGTINDFDYASSTLFAGVSSPSTKFSISQVKNIVGVETVETDESLRNRIRVAVASGATSNNSSIFSLLTSNPEVADYYIDTGVRGTGSADIVVYPRYNRVPASVLAKIQQGVLNLGAFGTDIKVIEPDYVPVSMELSVTSGSIRDTIDTVIENALKQIDRRYLSHSIITQTLARSGIIAKVNRLTVSGRDMLSSARIDILPTEMFELRPRNSAERAIEIV